MTCPSRSAAGPCRTRSPAVFRSATAACSAGSDASPLIATTAGVAPPGNASRTLLNDCTSLSDFGRASKPDWLVWRLRAGKARTRSTAVDAIAETSGRRRTAPSTAPQTRPWPSSFLSRPRNGTRTLLDPVAEPREDRGQDGERADHRDGDDHHRPDREGHERLVAGEEHAGHRDHHRDARDEHGPARRCCGSLECGASRCVRRDARHARGGCRTASSRRRRRGRSAGSPPRPTRPSARSGSAGRRGPALRRRP